jgi:hypothetical protein
VVPPGLLAGGAHSPGFENASGNTEGIRPDFRSCRAPETEINFRRQPGLVLFRRRAETAHLALAAASAAATPALGCAAGILLAPVARRAAAYRVTLYVKPPEDHDRGADQN